jgi:methionine-rich copper-binding protein CopC
VPIFRFAAALLGVLCAATASPALAHVLLVQADPPPNATVHAAPAALTLRFSEPIALALCQVLVRDATGREAQITAIPVPGATPSDVVVKLFPLTPGAYRVEWRAVARDSHNSNGSYSFTFTP